MDFNKLAGYLTKKEQKQIAKILTKALMRLYASSVIEEEVIKNVD